MSPESIDRFLAKVVWGEKFNGTHCLLWTGYLNERGYGTFRDGKMHRAHRWIYERWVGPIPGGLELDHLCRVRHCVNPLHMEPVTHQENMARGLNATKTRCLRGHEFNEENTYLAFNGVSFLRQCKACRELRRPRYDGAHQSH